MPLAQLMQKDNPSVRQQKSKPSDHDQANSQQRQGDNRLITYSMCRKSKKIDLKHGGSGHG